MLDKECLCVGLSNAAALTYGQTFIKTLNAVTICPGPNIVNFSKVVSLQTMADHIYGRKDILTNPYRSHMFIAELRLYIDYLREQLEDDIRTGHVSKRKKYYASFYSNLKDGIRYYQLLPGIADSGKGQFAKDLDKAGMELNCLNYQYGIDQ